MRESAFKIYNASAGSGKTFTLVKEYLKVLFSSQSRQGFHQILAVTFTNKAVNEMKQRIIYSLAIMSNTEGGEETTEMAEILKRELGITSEELRQKAKELLHKILHNYAYFDVSTIDKFTHRVIRSFARDLRISQNFEVVLDTDDLLNEAIDNLLSRSGDDAELTELVLAFATEKTDDEKHWDIHRDLFNTGKMLFQENDLPFIKYLETKSHSDFKALKIRIHSEISKIEKKVADIADQVLELISTLSLEHGDFPRQTLPNHFLKIRNRELNADRLYENKLEETLRAGKILKAGIELTDPQLPDKILERYLRIKSLIYRRAYLKNAYQNILPLTILNAIQQELKMLENEDDLLPISSFNVLISESIANQPAPFIYERLGEKYRHYFIDEFQDTSEMQWNNLIPLIENALVSLDMDGNPGSLLLVGDIKQAIYRWRGGQPEQFLDLVHSRNNPFTIEPEVNELETNYRSAKEIIDFNNSFFRSTASFVGSAIFQRLFLEETQQQSNNKMGGYVQLEFIETESESRDMDYLKNIQEAIEIALDNGYDYKDISILTRKKKQGVKISEGLISMGIPVISSETLLLKSNPKVMFLIRLLRAALNPGDLENRFYLLDFLIPDNQDYHSELIQAMDSMENWLIYHWNFNMSKFRLQSVYDGLEEAIKRFELLNTSDASIAFLMDEVLQVEQKLGSGISGFLEYWEHHEDKLSITAPENINAVSILTIHKAKGLEFPVVIFPYANSNIYEEKDPKIWYEVDPSDYEGFNYLLLNKKKQLLQYEDRVQRIYSEDHHKIELDAFNILYVALTRAVDALFIISELDLDSKGAHKPQLYSGVFIHFLKDIGIWTEHKSKYTFGNIEKVAVKSSDQNIQHLHIPYVKSTKSASAPKMVVKSNALWDDTEVDPRRRGTLMHYILSLIEYDKDVEAVMNFLKDQGILGFGETAEYRKKIYEIIQHSELSEYFSEPIKVENEREIITENGLILRPDRLVFKDDQVTIIDYKTGARSVAHKDQILSYSNALRQMGFSKINKVIVYIDEIVNVEYIQ